MAEEKPSISIVEIKLKNDGDSTYLRFFTKATFDFRLWVGEIEKTKFVWLSDKDVVCLDEVKRMRQLTDAEVLSLLAKMKGEANDATEQPTNGVFEPVRATDVRASSTGDDPDAEERSTSPDNAATC